MKSLDKVADDSALRRQLASIKIWRPDGMSVYSSPKALVGQRFWGGAISQALHGQITAAMADLDEDDSVFERKLSMPLYEVLAPLYRAGTGEVVAVGEFYHNATDLTIAPPLADVPIAIELTHESGNVTLFHTKTDSLSNYSVSIGVHGTVKRGRYSVQAHTAVSAAETSGPIVSLDVTN